CSYPGRRSPAGDRRRAGGRHRSHHRAAKREVALMGYMAGDYSAGDYYAGGLLSKIGTFLRKSPIIGKLPVIGQLQGAVNLAHAIHPPHATGTNPSNLPAVAHETALQGFVRRGGHLTTTGRLKAMAEHNAALQ